MIYIYVYIYIYISIIEFAFFSFNIDCSTPSDETNVLTFSGFAISAIFMMFMPYAVLLCMCLLCVTASTQV